LLQKQRSIFCKAKNFPDKNNALIIKIVFKTSIIMLVGIDQKAYGCYYQNKLLQKQTKAKNTLTIKH
jgi:hypothetical protein